MSAPPGRSSSSTNKGVCGAGAKAADRAYYSDVATPWVLKGDVLLRFRMAGLTQDQKSANFVPLARKALDRLQ